MTDSVLAKSARGSAYHIAVSAATILLGFTRSVLLMRLLSPDQFGVVSLALFFSTFASPFASFGIDSALIQKKDPGPRAFRTHFTLRLLLAAAVFSLSLAVSPLLRLAYTDFVVNVFLVLVAVHLIEATYATPTVILRRELRFGPLAALNLSASLAMTITAPLLAYLGAGLWSLVAEQAVAPLVRSAGIWLFLKPWKAGFALERAEAKEELRFGSHLLSSNLLGILLDRFDDFWTGTTLGSVPLGYYSRAYELAQYPERVIATPITNVFFSAYAAVQDSRKNLSRAFFRSSSFLVRVGLLLAVALFVLAPEITLILFTSTWLPIVPVFRLMLLYMMLDPFYVNLSYLLVGVGHPEVLARLRLVQLVFFVVTVILLSARWGINGVALAADGMMLVGVLILLFYSRRFVDFSLRRMFVWPLLAAAASVTAGWLLRSVAPSFSPWAAVLIEGLLMTAVYSTVLFLAERDIIRLYGTEIISPIFQQLKSRWSTKGVGNGTHMD